MPSGVGALGGRDKATTGSCADGGDDWREVASGVGGLVSGSCGWSALASADGE